MHNNSVPLLAFCARFPEPREPMFVSLTPASLSHKRHHEESIIETTESSTKRRIVEKPDTQGSNVGEPSYHAIAFNPTLPTISEEPLATSNAHARVRITMLQNSRQQGVRRNDTCPEQIPPAGIFYGRTKTEDPWTVTDLMALFPARHILFAVSGPPVNDHCYMPQVSGQEVGKRPQQDVVRGGDAGHSQTKHLGINPASR